MYVCFGYYIKGKLYSMHVRYRHSPVSVIFTHFLFSFFFSPSFINIPVPLLNLIFYLFNTRNHEAMVQTIF